MRQIALAIASQDWALAERTAHTLKGLAGNLGATDLQTHAGLLEAALRESPPAATLQTALARTTDALQKALASLRNAKSLFLVEAARELQCVTAAGREATRTQLAQIRELLANDDPGAADFWEENQPPIRAAYAEAEKIGTAINLFEFDQAIELIDALLKSASASS